MHRNQDQNSSLPAAWYLPLVANLFLEYKEAFGMFDKVNNGFIAARELKGLMRCLGCNPTDMELQQILNEIDARGELCTLAQDLRKHKEN